MRHNLIKASFSNISFSPKSNSKVFNYLSNIKIDKKENGESKVNNEQNFYLLGYIFNSGNHALRFGEFCELETPNKLIAQSIFLEWIKLASEGRKLNFDNDLVKNLSVKFNLIDFLERYSGRGV